MKSLQDLPDRFNIFPDLRDEIMACHDMLLNVKDACGDNYFNLYEKITKPPLKIKYFQKYELQHNTSENILNYHNIQNMIAKAEEQSGVYGLFSLQYELIPFLQNAAQEIITSYLWHQQRQPQSTIYPYQSFYFLNTLCDGSSRTKINALRIENSIQKVFGCDYIRVVAYRNSTYDDEYATHDMRTRFILDDAGGLSGQYFIKVNALVMDRFYGMQSIHTLFHEIGHYIGSRCLKAIPLMQILSKRIDREVKRRALNMIEHFFGEMFADSFAFASMRNLQYPKRYALSPRLLHGKNGFVDTPPKFMTQYVFPLTYNNVLLQKCGNDWAPYMNMPFIIEAARYCSLENPMVFAEFVVRKWLDEDWFIDLLLQHTCDTSRQLFLDTENPQYKPIIERYWETMYEDNREENFYWKSNPGESYMRDIKALKIYNQIKGIRNVFERISKSREVNNLFMKLNDIIG